LVAPILRQGAVARSVYLPRGTWFNFWTGETYQGQQHIVAQAPLEVLPLFVRAGAIIPMASVQQYVGENENGEINLHVWPGAPGRLDWYEDDGETMSYAIGDFHERTLTFRPHRHGGLFGIGAGIGAYASRVKTWRLILRAAERPAKAAVNGRRISGGFNRDAKLLAFDVPNSPGQLHVQIG
jgi:alpha-glucosidase